MKVKVKDLRAATHYTIEGNEDWLGFIYESFGIVPGGKGGRLTGQFTLTPQDYGVVTMKGSFNFLPNVPGGRCEESIAWPIDREIDVRFIEPYEPSAEELEEGFEKDLAPEDLDTYTIEDGQVDIEPVINDLVQTALPQRLVKASADGKTCTVCLADLQGPLVYRDEDQDKHNPFAVLKGLKLPEN